MTSNSLFTSIILLALLTGCAPIQRPADVIELTVAPESSPTATIAASPTSSLQLTKESCLAEGGTVESLSIDSEYFEGGFIFRVYTPPCYESHPENHYPVLYLIHGQGFSDDQWDRIGADEAADTMISSGQTAPFIIVMPYDHYSLRPTVGAFDDAFLGELLPWIDANYRTIADREHRAIGGLSRGASWAIHFALTEPDLFGAMGGHSPPVFIEEAKKVIEWLDAIPAGQMPRFWLDIGGRDTQNILQSAEFFEGLLSERNIPHEWRLYPGGDHSEEYWGSHVEEYLRWYAEPW
jgi:enterochelin esterase-like enzyme